MDFRAARRYRTEFGQVSSQGSGISADGGAGQTRRDPVGCDLPNRAFDEREKSREQLIVGDAGATQGL